MFDILWTGNLIINKKGINFIHVVLDMQEHWVGVILLVESALARRYSILPKLWITIMVHQYPKLPKGQCNMNFSTLYSQYGSRITVPANKTATNITVYTKTKTSL